MVPAGTFWDMDSRAALAEVAERRDLSFYDGRAVMADLLSGEVPEGVIGGLLVAWNMKGVTAEELAGLAQAMREHATPVPSRPKRLVDTCGTGGGPATWNLSTAAAIIAAAAGVPVAKHGNRSVTSSCGSADVLEACGVNIEASPEAVSRCLDQAGFAFLYAPKFHPAVRHVGPVRRSLGVRTIFNLLGPLSNPAGAERQMIGVWDHKFGPVVAGALHRLGTEQSVVVHAASGHDEMAAWGPTSVWLVEPKGVREEMWTPADFGVTNWDDDWMTAGNSIEENAKIFNESLNGHPRVAAAIPSAATALWLAEGAGSLSAAADLSRQAVASGAAAAKLQEIVKLSAEE